MINVKHIKLLQKSRILELDFDDGRHAEFSCAYLRAHSPSAENKHLSDDQREQLYQQKQEVNVIGIEPVGQYSVKIIIDDGHDNVIYSWDYLSKLSE